MGQYFLVVNPAKKQFVDAGRFAENEKASGVLCCLHGRAVGLLTCNIEQVPHEYSNLAGSWYGDAVVVAGDYAKPDGLGIKTSTDADPDRNLYEMARQEFEDISYQALSMLCLGNKWLAEELVKEARRWIVSDTLMSDHIAHYGNVVFQIGCEPLRKALEDEYGSDWPELYMKCRKLHEDYFFHDKWQPKDIT